MKSILLIWITIFSLSTVGGCSRPVQPDSLHPEDICAVCKMAVSDPDFAAQALLPNGDYLKFDDIGCLLLYRDVLPQYRVWIGKFEQKGWVRGDSGFYVKTDSIRTPMGFGYLSFDRKQAADSAVTNLGGKIVTWQQMIAKERLVK